jgi:hypothetical protein
MRSTTSSLRRTASAALLTVLALAAAAAERDRDSLPRVDDGPGLSLRIADEAAPAGSTVQLKLEVTEPKPISTGRGKIKPRGITTIQGIVLMNEGQDTFGVALVDGTDVSFTITSPSSVFGTPADYPILGIAGVVSPNASNGSTSTVAIDADGLLFRTPSGAMYPTEIDNGLLTIDRDAIAIGDVSPGSAVVRAGGVVRITGANFKPTTRIRVGESEVIEQRFISSQRIDVVLGETTRMHGARIRARNDEGDDDDDLKEGDERSESEYFAYERTTPSGASNDPLFSKTVPLFAPATWTAATVEMPKRTTRRRRAVRPAYGSATPPRNTTLGFALQNLESSNASVSIELLDSSGHPYAVNSVSLGSNRYLVREFSEVFGPVSPPSAFRIRSDTPVQILGLVADRTAQTAEALAPR